ncbi:MAG: hypothetical protein ACE5LU_29460, partial [Anaerolineae bacterium]
KDDSDLFQLIQRLTDEQPPEYALDLETVVVGDRLVLSTPPGVAMPASIREIEINLPGVHLLTVNPRQAGSQARENVPERDQPKRFASRYPRDGAGHVPQTLRHARWRRRRLVQPPHEHVACYGQMPVAKRQRLLPRQG